MVKDTYTLGDILKVVPEVKRATLIKWCERKIVIPIYEPPTAAGKRLFSYGNLLQIFVQAELSLFHIDAPIIRQYLKRFEQHGPGLDKFPALKRYQRCDYSGLHFSLKNRFLLPGSKEYQEFAWANRSPGTVITDDRRDITIDSSSSALFINLEAIQAELDKRIALVAEQEGWV